MADMKIAMTLTMADLASPEIQKFKANLAQLETYLKGLGDSFKVAIGGAADLGKATADAAGGIAALSRASSGATRTTGNLGEALQLMQDALTGMAAKISEIADSTAALATSTADMSAASKSAAAGLAAMGDAAGAADAKMAGMHGTLKGLIELYGAFKIGEGLKKSVEIASDYQQRLIQMQNMGTTRGEQRQMRGDARQWSTIPGVSKLDALEAANAAMAGAPGANPYQELVRQRLMPSILKAAVVLKTTYGDTSSIHDIVRNLLGIVETRGKIQNIAQGLKAVQSAFRVVAGTEGKIRIGDMETALRNTGYGEALRYSTRGFFGVEALHEQFKASGKAGGAGGNTKASTISTMVASMLLGGKMQKAEAIMLEQLGLITPADVQKIRGSSQVFVTPGAMPGSAAGLRNPIEWLRHQFDPRVRALMNKEHGNLTGSALNNAIMEWAATFAKTAGGVNVGTGIISTMDNEQWRAIKFRIQQMEKASSVETALTKASGSMALQMRQLHAAMQTVGQQIGSVLLPSLTLLAHLATDATQAIRDLNVNFPVFKKIEAWAGALAALLLGIKGVEWLMGIKEGFSAIKAVRLGTTMISLAGSMMGVSGSVAMVATKLGLMGGAALAAGYGIGMLLNKLLNYTTSKLTHGKGASFGQWLYYATHPGIGHNAQLRASPEMPLGIRMNNPGNLQPGGKEAYFANPEAGMFAMAHTLLGYKSNTLSGIISTYAPHRNAAGKIINDTASYIRDVAHRTGFKPGQPLDLHNANTLAQLMTAMIHHENGIVPYSPESILIAARTAAGAHGVSIQNTALAHERALMNARVAAINPATLGYSGPVTAQGVAKAKAIAAKHTGALEHVRTMGENKLSAAFAHKIAEGERYAAKLNEIADKIHIAWLAITNPLNAKIVAARSKYSGLSGELLAGGHANAAKEALQVGHHQVLAYQYQGAMQHLSALKGNLHQNLTNTAALVTAGSLTKMEAAQQTIQMQKQAAPAMIQAADAALKYAKALGDPKLVQALQEQRAHLQAMGKQLGYYSASVKNTMQGAFTGLFQNIMHGQKTWGQMFYSFFASIGNGIENILAKSISQSITQSLFGKKANQGIGSIIGGLAHMAGALFGGSGSSAAGVGAVQHGGQSSMSSVGGWIKDITSIASLFGFASGANSIPNDMVANIHKGEMIIPAAGASLIRSGQASIGGMPGGNHVHLTIHAMDSQSVISALHSVRHEAAQMFINTASHLNLNGG